MEQGTQHIYLVGARGSGKTSVGKALAALLGCTFADTDAVLCAMQDVTVAEIVEREGWDAFRQYESEALHAASDTVRSVIATGGGMVLSEANRNYMRTHGQVFFLDVPVAELARRLSADPLEAQRPSLTGKSLVEEIEEVITAREALYKDAAHHGVDGAQSIEKIVDNIVELLETEADS